MESTGSRRTLFLFAASSLAAICAGSAIMALMGLPPGSWLRNPIAWLAGLVLAGGFLVGGRAAMVPRVLVALAVVGLAGTFLAEDQDGVHRWIDLGPLHVNVAALLLPAAVVALAFIGSWTRIGLVASAVIMALLVLQPDASQATAFVLAMLVLLARSPASRPLRLAAAALAVGAAALAWRRADPLEPVAEVEEIFSVALAISPALAAVAVACLAAVALVPLAINAGAGREARDAALALTAYLAATALAPAIGDFPVPLVGLGMSFPVGWWLAIGLLCARTSTLKSRSTAA